MKRIFGILPVPGQTRAFAVGLGLCMAYFSLIRAVFFLKHRTLFSTLSPREVLGGFATGLRFDLNVIAILLAFFFLALHLPGRWKDRPAIAAPLLWAPAVLMIGALFVLLVDINYFDDSGRHLSFEIFNLGNDTGSLGRMALYYSWSILAFFLLSVSFLYLWRRWVTRPWEKSRTPAHPDSPQGSSPEPPRHPTLLVESVFLAVFLFALFVSVRGSLGAKPLRAGYAFSGGRAEVGALALNGVFTVANTLRAGDIRPLVFFPPGESAAIARDLVADPGEIFPDPDFPLFRHDSGDRRSGNPAEPPPNLVVIVLESWPAEYTGATGGFPETTPVFDALARDGLIFDDFYATGRRSIDGISAICLGVPSFNDLSILSGAYEQNNYRGMARALRDDGYSSVFLHGAHVGSFGLVGFAGVAGFERYVGLEDLAVEKDDLDGTWGVWDHVMAGQVVRELSTEKEPFLGLWFTLSSHTPFAVPEERFHVTPREEPDAPFRDSMRYTDEALGVFFAEARRQEWFSHTVFVLAADHTAGHGLAGMRERHRVPFLLYGPGLIPPGVSHRTSSQCDIIPTLLDLARSSAGHHAFGKSMLGEGDGFAFLNPGDGYGWIEKGQLLDTDVSGQAPGPQDPHLLRHLRSFLQTGRELIRKNRLAP